MTKLTKRKEIG